MPYFVRNACEDCPDRPTQCDRRCSDAFTFADEADCEQCDLCPEDAGCCPWMLEAFWACEHCHEEFEGWSAADDHEEECQDNPDVAELRPIKCLDPERRTCGTCRHHETAAMRFSADCPHGQTRFDCDDWALADEYAWLAARRPVPGQLPLPLGGLHA